jgi:hypothetical protein
MGQNAFAKWFQLDRTEEAEPAACFAARWVDEFVPVDQEPRFRLPPQNTFLLPKLVKVGRSKVLVVLRRVGRPHLTSDQANDIVRILPVKPHPIFIADDVVGRRDDPRKIDPGWVVHDPPERPKDRQAPRG